MVQKLSTDPVILEIFYVKELSNLTSQENIGTKIQEPDC